ncbi:MAG: HNH endonuclease [Anaerolineae bacterium]
MSKRYLPADLREQLLAADDQRCVYCYTTEANTGQPMTVDHVVPEVQGGPTTFDNLCYACRRCNEFKGSTTTARDPLTHEVVPLFHPRTQMWSHHFASPRPFSHLTIQAIHPSVSLSSPQVLSVPLTSHTTDQW